jgi:cupin 2 domain-containing protein
MKSAEIYNIFSGLPDDCQQEVFEDILRGSNIRIERIVSTGQITAEGEWYDQPHEEWVLLLSGGAELLIEGKSETLKLQAGDSVLLTSGCRHRVVWTDPDQKTIWLAVHYGEGMTDASC